MLLRTLVSIVSLVAVVIAILMQFLLPPLRFIIFYAVMIWIFAQLFLYRLPVMSRPVGGGSRSAPVASPRRSGPTGLPGPPPGTSTADIGFCMYCGAILEPGTPICPSCSRSLPLT